MSTFDGSVSVVSPYVTDVVNTANVNDSKGQTSYIA